MEVHYKPTFVRQFKKLEPALQDEVLERIQLLKNNWKHPSLKMHKLGGKLKGCSSFSVNYAIRVVLEYENKDTVVLLAVGDHDVYVR